MDEGQTYLGESVLVKTKQGGAQLLSAQGEILNVFEGEVSGGEGMALAVSGMSAVAGKQELTFRMAGEMGETLARQNAVAGAILSGGSLGFSTIAGESESPVYQGIKLTADIGLAGLGTIGGPYGAIGAFVLDLTAKDSAVEWATSEILESRVDRVLTRKKRMKPR